jgi:hypothetical protein
MQYRKFTPHSNLVFTSALVALTLWLAGCGGGPSKTEAPDSGQQGGRVALVTPNRWVTANELRNAVELGFKKHVLAGEDADHANVIEPAAANVRWSDLQGRMNALMGSSTPSVLGHGVRVFHGLEPVAQHSGVYRSVQALELVRLKGTVDPGSYAVENVVGFFFMIDPQSGALEPTTENDWFKSGAPGDLYRRHMFIHRAHPFGSPDPIGTPEAYKLDTDVQAITFPWEDELLPLGQQNNGAVYLQFVNIAEHTADDAAGRTGIHHRFCAVLLRADGSPIISETPTPTDKPYAERGADVGSPCPSMCRKVAFPLNGTPVVTDWSRP